MREEGRGKALFGNARRKGGALAKIISAEITHKNAKGPPTWQTGGVRTLIALHRGRKTKSESFTSCRGRVNISGGSKIARINVERNGDSLPFAIPSKVKKCWQACATPVIPP